MAIHIINHKQQTFHERFYSNIQSQAEAIIVCFLINITIQKKQKMATLIIMLISVLQVCLVMEYAEGGSLYNGKLYGK